MEQLKILIVDDEKYEALLVEKCVNWADHGFAVVGSAQSAQEALRLFEQEAPDIVLCDINMPVMDGLELCRRMKARRPDVCLVIITGHRDFAYAQQSIELGVKSYLLKPIQSDELLRTVERIRSELETSPGPLAGIRNDLIRTAVFYIEDHLSVSGLSLRTIASAIYTNSSYLSRVFREEMGETVTDYIWHRRMEKGKELFASTDRRVYEVATRVGIPDAHYFGQCFKKYTGVTVREYRRTHRPGEKEKDGGREE